MNQPLYIQAASAISPQQSYVRQHFLRPVIETSQGHLYVAEADYRKHISPVAIRRMSKPLKMAISTAMQCLEEGSIRTPDAIITGTGRGSVTDMEMLVKDMIRLDEEALNPTLFIQSTYNSPNGWIAMQSGCTGYNQTYVHRGCSLELALLDAQMLVAEAGNHTTALVGCYDEMTEDYFIIKGKIGYWKSPVPESNLRLFDSSESAGSIGGEGAAFFLLSGQPGKAVSKIAAFKMLQNATAASISTAVTSMLESAEISRDAIDFVLTGMNGDARQQGLYAFLNNFRSCGAFKQLCGEYDTATGFGLWLADHVLKEQNVPKEVLLDASGAPQQLDNILLVNHYLHGSASVILLQRVAQGA